MVQGADHFRLLAFSGCLCLDSQLIDVGIRTYLFQSGIAGSGNNKRTGHQVVSRIFPDLVRLTGQQGFIYCDRALHHNGVSGNLVSGVKYDNVVQNQMLGGDCFLLSVPDDRCLGRVQNRQIIQHIFCAQLLNDADQRVCDNNRKKREILKGFHQNQQDGNQQKNSVKIGQDIAFYNIFCRFGGRFNRNVSPPVFPVINNLLFSQAGVIIRQNFVYRMPFGHGRIQNSFFSSSGRHNRTLPFVFLRDILFYEKPDLIGRKLRLHTGSM